MTTRQVSQDTWLPLGATSGGGGVNFALFSAHATGVMLELFASPDGEDIVGPDDEVALDPANESRANQRSSLVLLARAPGAATWHRTLARGT